MIDTPRVRHATPDDVAWLVENDTHVGGEWVRRCVGHGEYLICEREDDRVGLLRHSLFWGNIPYMDMIFVLGDHRRCGAGTALFDAWEAGMRRVGATVLMTSHMLDEEEPGEWHRRNGFEESGRIAFGPLQPSPEVFLVKAL